MVEMKPLEPADLYLRCDPEQFDFETTAELDDLTDIIGQPRAVEAVRFAVGIDHPGYNLYVLGGSGTGKQTLLRQYLEQRAAERPVPNDWCYVNNFEDPQKPRVLALPPGMGPELRRDMDRLVKELRTGIAAVFESEEYQARREAIEREFKERPGKAFNELKRAAEERGVAVLRTPLGLVAAPIINGDVVPPEAFERLPEEERQRLLAEAEAIQAQISRLFQQIVRWEREHQERVRDLDREVMTLTADHLIDDLRKKYAGLDAVLAYLDSVQQDVVENGRELFYSDDGSPLPQVSADDSPPRRYRVNVLVSHDGARGAPVIYEDNPTYQNLVGRVEHIAQMGTLVTDFNLVKPGALHRANGGYLILDAEKVLSNPFAWAALKRALQSNQIRIESLERALSLASTISLEPEPIPLDVKVALVGDRRIYYLLYELDPDFSELFKVPADFDEEMERNPENQALYARLIATLGRKEGLRPFHRTAVARVVEEGARMAGDAERLSTHMRSIADLLCQADYYAGKAGREVILADDIEQAIASRIYRSNRIQQRRLQETLRGTIRIDTDGAAVGQVNGLSVVRLADFSFGFPVRITAQVRPGTGGVLDIEREVELGGPIHSKGVLTLSGFLGARYSRERPLTFSASLVFEQSYSQVEGDSASSAELYALLSAIAQVPLKQSLAVTGSVDQHGRVQAIGGVNEKIEGFFDLCAARGLTGRQGVLIPAANVKHLMLRRDVVEAAAAGRFHIYPVETVDQGIELLTGLPAGERDADGKYPEGSFNALVEQRLAAMAEQVLEFRPALAKSNSH